MIKLIDIFKTAVVALVCLLVAVFVLALFSGCASVPSNGPDYRSSNTAPGEVHTVRNHWGRVAAKSDGVWRIKEPPQLVFTGRTVTGQEIRKWATQHGIRVIGVEADAKYAQVTAESAINCVLWLKRFQWDIGYVYISEARDCDNFARLARTFPDLFAADAPPDAQAAVFGIYAHMVRPFAGVTDGYHALNVAWTKEGVPVFEPQGTDLVYQDLRHWPNRTGITHALFD